jgi:hypothetical protein
VKNQEHQQPTETTLSNWINIIIIIIIMVWSSFQGRSVLFAFVLMQAASLLFILDAMAGYMNITTLLGHENLATTPRQQQEQQQQQQQQSQQQRNLLQNNNNNDNNLPLMPKNVQQGQRSLHPKWKLWTEMNEMEQHDAMLQSNAYLNKYGKLITKARGPTSQQKITHGSCPLVPMGGQTDHQLCGPPPPLSGGNCTFLSFGINDDPSFDIAVATDWHCRGFAGDPTVLHPSKLHELVTFHSVGATTLKNNEERIINKGGNVPWWEVSMPMVRQFLRLDHIDILKLDCEGCEMALARDILVEDPGFLFTVDQISVETHVSKTWMDTNEHVYYFGLLFALLEEAGFVMEWSSIFGCSKRHEIAGCLESLKQTDFPCGYKPWPQRPNVVRGYSCQDFLFRRIIPSGSEETLQRRNS